MHQRSAHIPQTTSVAVVRLSKWHHQPPGWWSLLITSHSVPSGPISNQWPRVTECCLYHKFVLFPSSLRLVPWYQLPWYQWRHCEGRPGAPFPSISPNVIGSPLGVLQCPPGGRSRPSLPGSSVPASCPRLLRAFVKSPSAHTSPPAPSQLSHAVSLLPGARPPRSFLIHPRRPSPMNLSGSYRQALSWALSWCCCPNFPLFIQRLILPLRFSRAFWVLRACSRDLRSYSPLHYCLLIHAKQAFHREIVHRNVLKPQCEARVTYKQMHWDGCLNSELYTQKRLQTIQTSEESPCWVPLSYTSIHAWGWATEQRRIALQFRGGGHKAKVTDEHPLCIHFQ